MDPEATLQLLASAIEARDIAGAVEALNNYYRWRVRGGFEPTNGDDRADTLANRLADVCEPAE